MVEWKKILGGQKKPLFEVPGSLSDEPLDLYAERYLVPANEVHPANLESIEEHYCEIFQDTEADTSLLIFGAGHSIHANRIREVCTHFSSITATDLVPEAAVGLRDDVEFFTADIFNYDFYRTYDYIYTAHTLEHFTKRDLLGVVVPKLRSAAKKALVVVVPYADAWSDEVYHCCRFYEDDEFAGLADKYKIIRGGQEIVYWLSGRSL